MLGALLALDWPLRPACPGARTAGASLFLVPRAVHDHGPECGVGWQEGPTLPSCSRGASPSSVTWGLRSLATCSPRGVTTALNREPAGVGALHSRCAHSERRFCSAGPQAEGRSRFWLKWHRLLQFMRLSRFSRVNVSSFAVCS